MKSFVDKVESANAVQFAAVNLSLAKALPGKIKLTAPSLSSLNANAADPQFNSVEFKASLLQLSLKLLHDFMNLYKANDSFPEVSDRSNTMIGSN